MIQKSLHSTMIQFALKDSLYESRRRYQKNARELAVFERSISDGSHRRIDAAMLEQKRAKLSNIAEDQVRLEATIPQLDRTSKAFESLSHKEKVMLNKRLDAGADQRYELTLKDRATGEFLAQQAA